MLDETKLEDYIKDADLVITGEGRMDGQTAMGKAPVGVAKLAKKYGKKVIAFAGAVQRDARACNDAGIDAFFPILRGVVTLEEARVMSDQDTMTYTYYQKHVKPKPQTEGKKGWVCKVCGYIYEGDELPEDIICPLCKHGAVDFEPIEG